ncbi:hypothetical protein ABIA35_000312 [Catenulispora sp. MAP12-49]
MPTTVRHERDWRLRITDAKTVRDALKGARNSTNG